MPLNNIVFKTTTVTLWSSSCKYVIVGYNNKGMVWSWYTPPELHGVLTLNLLEFLASELSIYMNIQKLGNGDHILAFTDISRDIGWMHKASFDPVNEGGHKTVE